MDEPLAYCTRIFLFSSTLLLFAGGGQCLRLSQRKTLEAAHRDDAASSHRSSSSHVDVRISGGTIRGYVSHSGGWSRPANVFKGVPLAEAPIGLPPIRPTFSGVKKPI